MSVPQLFSLIRYSHPYTITLAQKTRRDAGSIEWVKSLKVLEDGKYQDHELMFTREGRKGERRTPQGIRRNQSTH